MRYAGGASAVNMVKNARKIVMLYSTIGIRMTRHKLRIIVNPPARALAMITVVFGSVATMTTAEAEEAAVEAVMTNVR